MENMNDWFSVVFFTASIASLALAIVAIWISFYIKRQADRVNEKTTDLLVEIKSDAKAISQVAMPELKAYGDSMRRFVLNGGELKEGNNPKGDILDKLEELDEKIKSLSKEDDISKLKSELVKVSSEIKNSELSVAKSLSQPEELQRGIRVKVPSGASVETSSPKDTWRELLNLSIALSGKGISKDNYGKNWLLINTKTKQALAKDYIKEPNIEFSDMSLSTGDELELINIE